MPDPAHAAERGAARRFLTFRIGERLYALEAEAVAEVIRLPAVARVPQAPEGLLGIGNIRGAAVPVASLRGLLGLPQGEAHASTRAILIAGGAPVALAVDEVEGLVEVEAGRLETRQAELAAEPGERLQGAFRGSGQGEIAKVLDLPTLLAEAFRPRPSAERRAGARGAAALEGDRTSLAAAEERRRLVTFAVSGQEFGLDLELVREILPAPDTVAAVPRSEAAVVGVTPYRDTLLPLFSLRGLLGFEAQAVGGERAKVIVAAAGGGLVGLLADGMCALLSVEPELLEPIPPALAARAGGEAQIQSIYRAEGGRRLVSVLNPEQLFREDVMQRLRDRVGAQEGGSATDGAAGDELQVLVFRLGDDEFGLPIEAVDEVARVPERVTRVPKTPKFLEGVVNLRGEVVPVVDQRRRFQMTPLARNEAQRLVVVRTERHRAGLIVDSVSQVLRTSSEALEPAPELAGETNALVRAVVNLSDAERMVLLLDPAELLSRAERGLLDAFQAEDEQAQA